MRLTRLRSDNHLAIRVSHRKEHGRQCARYLLRCGCCEERIKIYYDENSLEIGGVHGSLQNWKEILLPLLEENRDAL